MKIREASKYGCDRRAQLVNVRLRSWSYVLARADSAPNPEKTGNIAIRHCQKPDSERYCGSHQLESGAREGATLVVVLVGVAATKSVREEESIYNQRKGAHYN